MNAAALFRDAARAHPERIAFFDEERQTTFGALWERVSRFGGALHERGFGRGDRALIMLPMSVELYVALLAVLKEGGVAVFLDPWVSARTRIRLARYARPKAWLGTPMSHVLRLLGGRVPIAPLSLASFTRRGERREEIHETADDDGALITFTTGSSGVPKGVNRTHRILIAQHERLAAEFPPEEGDVDLCTFPVFALNNLALGVPTVIPPVDLRRVADADPERVARIARRCGVTTATASPPLFDRLAGVQERPRLRRILTGGAPVDDAQLREWMAAWPDSEIVVAYGSSEAEPVAHITAHERLAAGGLGYVAGPIVAGVRARIAPLIDGSEIGELFVAGDHVCRDYAGDPHATRENKVIDPDGTVWHRMGDTGWFDEAGRYRIAGRVHTTIWRNGEPVHAQLVEQAARGDDPRIRRVAAVGVEGRVLVVVEVFESSSRRVVERLIERRTLDDSTTRRFEDSVRARIESAGFPVDEIRVTRDPLPVDPRHNSKVDYEAVRRALRIR